MLSFGEWRLDTVARHLLDREGTAIALSGAEYRLLRVFIDHPQRVLNPDQPAGCASGLAMMRANRPTSRPCEVSTSPMLTACKALPGRSAGVMRSPQML